MVHVYENVDATPSAAVWLRLDNIKTTVAAGAPGIGDDNTLGYEPFSVWEDTTGAPDLYMCLDASTGAAVWQKFQGSLSLPLGITEGGTGANNGGATTGQVLTFNGTVFVAGGEANIESHWGGIATATFGATTTLDASASDKHTVTLTGDTTLAISGGKDGQVLLIEIVQDGTGGHSLIWPGTTIWPGGSPPTLSTAPGAIDVFNLLQRSSGNYYGFVAGQAMA